jgi:hypothetical protein
LTPEERQAARRLAEDLDDLLAGWEPSSMALLGAPVLRWWSWRRCKNTGWPPMVPTPFYLLGVFHERRPSIGSTLQATDEIYWMAHDLTWCRCADGWYRLGEYETEVPMYLEGFT